MCSVDPPGCKDIDDALHVRRLPNGNWEVRQTHRDECAQDTAFLYTGGAWTRLGAGKSDKAAETSLPHGLERRVRCKGQSEAMCVCAW